MGMARLPRIVDEVNTKLPYRPRVYGPYNTETEPG